MREGYDPHFLGTEVAAPASTHGDGVLLDGSDVLLYTHFSLHLSAERRLARWVAWTIDAATLRSGDLVSRKGLRFAADPRLPASVQTLDDVYDHNRLDRGHLARRADLLWGSDAAAHAANRDSFFFTNICPQMDSFNQSRVGGLWGNLEDALREFVVDGGGTRAAVLAGPVLAASDPVYRGCGVPLDFWKVLAHVDAAGALRVRAFLVTQDLDGLAGAWIDDEYRLYGLPVSDVSARTGLVFADAVLDADVTRGVLPAVQRIDALADIAW